MIPLQISDILTMHESYTAEQSCGDILGDAFLMRSNPLYKNIKAFALGIGCKYVEAWPQYMLMPFYELNKIVATKTIPYVPSRRVLEEVERQRPGVLNSQDLQIPESYHLHEAAHVIADHLFQKFEPVKTREEKILKSLLCESFANTVDALACLPADNDMHLFFLKQNCYMYPRKSYIDMLSRLVKSVGPRCTFMLTLMAYLHSNFLHKSFSKSDMKTWIDRSGAGADLGANGKVTKDCEALVRMAEKLDPQFRISTTQVYLKLEGYDGDALEVLDFPFMDIFEKNKVFRQVAEAMADAAGFGTVAARQTARPL